MREYIRVDRMGPVWLVTIDRPEAMNALDLEGNDQLVRVWQAFEVDPDARAAVITGTGNAAFCAGADLKAYTMAYARTPAPQFRDTYTNGPGFGGITRTMRVLKPIVAAINGYAISGGLELALACDVRFCSPNAEFGHQDVRWGFHPCDGGLVRLPQIVGLGHAMAMILSGDRIGSDEAYRIGLVNRVVPAQSLLEEALAYAQRLASRSPLAQRAAKEVIQRSYGLSMEEALRLESRSFHDLADSDDLQEGTNAFAEKRSPRFRGR